MPYLAPTGREEALSFLRETGARVIAGCTDYFPARGQGEIDDNLLDITRVEGLRGITATAEGTRIGAATTWTDIVRAPLAPAFDALRQAAREVGSVQIQNRGTVAGNICNASPAADGVPPLLALDASVEILSSDGTRTVPLAAFITGVRQVDLASGEIVSGILVPPVPGQAGSAFHKLGSRTHLVISIAMVAAVAGLRDGRVTGARLAVGSCSPVACRLPALEARLEGATPDDIRKMDMSEDDALAPLSPISDVRGSADYRRDVVAEMCRRAILSAVGEG